YHLIIWVGLFGLVASFHGIILAAGRATFEFGRVGYAPKIFGKTHKKFKTPAPALIFNMLIGILAVLSNETGAIITIACFGALSLYIISMLSFFKLRKDQPDLERPFKMIGYPVLPGLALVISSISLVAMTYYNLKTAAIFYGIMLLSFLWFKFFVNDDVKQAATSA
ncbi:MAG: amino acid permease, partial [Halobacteriovoraceae bacterium]|nr:amino acid permease [Halobacteriovoraceae bacterium]